MLDHQFGGVIQIFVEEDTRGESSESGMGGSQSVFDIFSRCRLTGGLLNLSRLRSKNLTHTTTVTELQYADDNADINHLQQSVNNFHAAYSRVVSL